MQLIPYSPKAGHVRENYKSPTPRKAPSKSAGAARKVRDRIPLVDIPGSPARGMVDRAMTRRLPPTVRQALSRPIISHAPNGHGAAHAPSGGAGGFFRPGFPRTLSNALTAVLIWRIHGFTTISKDAEVAGVGGDCQCGYT